MGIDIESLLQITESPGFDGTDATDVVATTTYSLKDSTSSNAHLLAQSSQLLSHGLGNIVKAIIVRPA